MSGVDDLLERIRNQMTLDCETEQEILYELRGHLDAAVEQAQAEGLTEAEALDLAASRFGLEEQIGQELQATHAGRGTADAVVSAALPVICALVLRWLVFAPDGTALDWPQLLSRPALWAVAVSALLIPLLKFERWRYALATWAFFWGLTVLFVTLPAQRW
jgi:hypothetical protein